MLLPVKEFLLWVIYHRGTVNTLPATLSGRSIQGHTRALTSKCCHTVQYRAYSIKRHTRQHGRYSCLLTGVQADGQATSDKLLGSAMLAAAAFVFTYYTTWALFLVRPFSLRIQPFVLLSLSTLLELLNLSHLTRNG